MMDRTCEVFNITVHFRDMINSQEEERTDKAHGQRNDYVQYNTVETGGIEEIISEKKLG